jgi:hypothetical protein
MRAMTRRDLLKMLPLAGLGLWVNGGRAQAAPAYFLLTDDPEGDLWRLTRAAPTSSVPVAVSRTPVAASPQDLTLLVHGVPVDPLRQRVPAGVSALAAEMRRRQQPAHTLLAIEPQAVPVGSEVLFEVDGVLVERVRLDRTYHHIEIAGVQGTNVFKLEKGSLSVVRTSCRHELCRKAGARSSGRIICAPNRLVATMPQSHGLVDVVTG